MKTNEKITLYEPENFEENYKGVFGRPVVNEL